MTHPRISHVKRRLGRALATKSAAVVDRSIAPVSPRLASRIDMARPSLRAPWGGPLNGQSHRQQIIRDLARAIDFDEVVETGTYRGTSTEFFAHVFGKPVHTVEANPRFYEYSVWRLANYPSVAVEQGDSRAFLRRLASRGGSDRTTLFYLDAHWEQDLPLREEVEIVAAHWGRAVIVIDDFEVPGDAGYGFDDYGPGKRLTAEYLPDLSGWTVAYPSAASRDETGVRRGCVILASPSLGPTVMGLPSLRPMTTLRGSTRS